MACAGRLLTLLLAYDFAFITDTLTLVRFRLPQGAHRSRELTHAFLIGTTDLDDVLLYRAGDPFRDSHQHRVRKAQVHFKILPRDLGAIADTFDLKILRKRRVDAVDHVANMRRIGAPQSACESGLLCRLNMHFLAVYLYGDRRMQRAIQGAALTFNCDHIRDDRDFGACGDRDCSFSDS